MVSDISESDHVECCWGEIRLKLYNRNVKSVTYSIITLSHTISGRGNTLYDSVISTVYHTNHITENEIYFRTGLDGFKTESTLTNNIVSTHEGLQYNIWIISW